MCNKKIKLNLQMAWLVGMTFCCTAPVVLAGPLDREEMQPRNNPAASSMIRVPGVLGQSERDALEILQRAGLNVNAKYIRQSVEKYAGRSGMVVKQTPSAGGISMLGSSVTIVIYKVEGKPVEESGDYGDAGGYGSTGGGYDDTGNTGDYGNNAGAYSGDAGDGYGKSGEGTGNVDGTYGDSAGDGYSDKGYGTDESAPEDGASGPDWGSPGSDFEGGNSAP